MTRLSNLAKNLCTNSLWTIFHWISLLLTRNVSCAKVGHHQSNRNPSFPFSVNLVSHSLLSLENSTRAHLLLNLLLPVVSRWRLNFYHWFLYFVWLLNPWFDGLILGLIWNMDETESINQKLRMKCIMIGGVKEQLSVYFHKKPNWTVSLKQK